MGRCQAALAREETESVGGAHPASLECSRSITLAARERTGQSRSWRLSSIAAPRLRQVHEGDRVGDIRARTPTCGGARRRGSRRRQGALRPRHGDASCARSALRASAMGPPDEVRYRRRMLSRTRARYLLAMGLLPSAAVAAAACRRTGTPEGTVSAQDAASSASILAKSSGGASSDAAAANAVPRRPDGLRGLGAPT